MTPSCLAISLSAEYSRLRRQFRAVASVNGRNYRSSEPSLTTKGSLFAVAAGVDACLRRHRRRRPDGCRRAFRTRLSASKLEIRGFLPRTCRRSRRRHDRNERTNEIRNNACKRSPRVE